MIAVT